jgi:hypothetical protein
MESQETKQRIKDYFVEIKEDKFTKVKTIQCLHKIEWKGKELENKFMLTKDSYSNSLTMSIDYRHKDDVDSVFFRFTYSNSEGGYPGMSNIKMYLILDDDKTIELSDGSGFDHASQSSKIGDNYISVYIETAQLAVSMSDFIAIANAKKIEYSIRFGQGSLENVFTQNNLLIFKGFYNSAFDSDFELSSLSNLSSVDGSSVYSSLFDLNSIQNDLILDESESRNRMNNGLHKWRNDYSIDGEIIFGLNPNPLNKNLTNVFTQNGIYQQASGARANFIEYSSGPNFTFKKASFLGSNKLIDDKTGFFIDLVSINPGYEKGQKIINTLMDFIQSKIEK